ncbi:hypothetical protein ACQP2P_11460 [Dactylosporangium sp. CA-139114]|uniref:hypothetical protein n=1 Tax=Dactylosporangium sp. CA-139114 TaxID=3239931 RepID=UPI003D99B486
MTGDRSLPTYLTPGTLLDRLAILELKLERVRDLEARRVAERELAGLSAAWANTGVSTDAGPLRTINSELWDLENEIRRCEREKRFDESFVDAVQRIQWLNSERADARATVNAAFPMELVEAEVGLDSYADQIAIGQVRSARSKASSDIGWETLRDIWFGYGIEDVFSSTRFGELRHANWRLWTVKDEVQRFLSSDALSPAAVAAYRSIYLVNDARCRLKRALAIDLRSAFYEVKSYTPYEPPANWDATQLSFPAS